MTPDNPPLVVTVPADVDAPDKIVYGLTVRQVLLLGSCAATLWLAYQALTPAVPPAVIGIAALPVLAVTAAVALGRRDGVSLDRWLGAALRAARHPHLLIASPTTVLRAPQWSPAAGARHPALAPLRLPAEAIGADGVVDTGAGGAALACVGTVNLGLRTDGEQRALVETMGAWLNALSAPAQIVVSTRSVDLLACAQRIHERVDALPHPALADAASAYADFLHQLGEHRDPLTRRVTIAHHAPPGAVSARRAAEQTARSLSALGGPSCVLDGDQVADALVSSCHPWQPVSTGRTTPDTVISAGPVPA